MNNRRIVIYGGSSYISEELIKILSKDYSKFTIICRNKNYIENYISKNEGIWKADSLRISLYGIDANSYEFITRVKKGFEQVKKNTINFLKRRNQIIYSSYHNLMDSGAHWPYDVDESRISI